MDHLDVERAHFVGHDRGAALAWTAGALMPERVDHLVALSLDNADHGTRSYICSRGSFREEG